MPPFQPSAYAIAKNLIWARGVKNIKHSSLDIFKDYWEEFNTMRVPILGEDRFFEIALELEHMATDEEDLNRFLRERRELWEKEATKWLSVVSSKWFFPEDDDFPCADASGTAYRASKTGSLQHFLELLNGVVYGWAADEVEDGAEDAARSPSTESHDNARYDMKQPDFRTYYGELLKSKNPIYQPTFDENFHKAPLFTSDTLSLLRQHVSNENTDQKEKSPNTSKIGSAGSIKDQSRPNKRPRIEDETDGQAHKRQKRELVAYTDTSANSNSGNTSFATSSTNTHSTYVTQGTPARAARDTLQKNQSRTPTGATTPPLSKIGLCVDDKGGERGRKRQSTSSEPPSPKYPEISNTSAREKSTHISNVRDKRKNAMAYNQCLPQHLPQHLPNHISHVHLERLRNDIQTRGVLDAHHPCLYL